MNYFSHLWGFKIFLLFFFSLKLSESRLTAVRSIQHLGYLKRELERLLGCVIIYTYEYICRYILLNSCSFHRSKLARTEYRTEVVAVAAHNNQSGNKVHVVNTPLACQVRGSAIIIELCQSQWHYRDTTVTIIFSLISIYIQLIILQMINNTRISNNHIYIYIYIYIHIFLFLSTHIIHISKLIR